MGTLTLDANQTIESLVGHVHSQDEPVVVFDGDDECLVAMRPAVFERILFDGNLLNCHYRETLHF